MTPPITARSLRARLPHATRLGDDDFQSRLHVVRLGLVFFAATVVGIGLAAERPVWQVALEISPVLACLLVCCRTRSRTLSTAAVTLGLTMCATILVHLTGGLMESHSAFFVVLPLVALLHDWRAVIGSTLLVFTHHALAGSVQSLQVYNHPEAAEHPLLWSGVHALLIFGLVLVLFVHWNYAEIEQQATQDALAEVTRTRNEVDETGRHFRSLVQNAFDAIILIDADKTITYIGGAFDSSFGWSPNDLLGRHADSLLGLVHQHDLPSIRTALDLLRKSSDVQFIEARFRHPDGPWHWLELVVRPMRPDHQAHPSASATGLVINARNVTTAKLANDLLAHQATHDELTGLANRSVLVDALDQALDDGPPDSVGVLFIDLDRFKNVNDSLGHHVGDELLSHVARRLESTVGSGGTVARLGGDEFAVLVNGTSTPETLRALGEHLATQLAGPFTVGNVQLRASASIGIALGSSGDDATLLLRNADGAMYQAKQAGRDQIAEFDEKFRDRVDKRLVIEAELRVANYETEMALHYQPVVDVQSGALVAVEALIRWDHPTRGMLMPGEFIDVAEDTGLILRLGEWVLHEACRQAAAWQLHQGVAIEMAVNVSARQLGQPGFARIVQQAIEASGIAPDKLLLEVTESALVDDPVMATANLTELRRLGVSAALDDYGTGYASLRYLRTLPLTHIKIDRSFTSGLGSSQQSTTIVENTVSLARGLGLVVVAEGVETAEQFEMLHDFGCDFAQGYHLARPMCPHKFAEHRLFAAKAAVSAPDERSDISLH